MPVTRNLISVKKSLAEAFPDIAFTWGTAGRGHNRRHACSWVGGPEAFTVRMAAEIPWRAVYHFTRIDTPEEAEARHAEFMKQWEADLAAEPARRASAKAAGIAKRAETTAAKRGALATLAAAFPGVAFKVSAATYGRFNIAWQDGPEVEAVKCLPNLDRDNFERSRSSAAIAAALESAFAATHLGVAYQVEVHASYDRAEIIWTNGPSVREVEALIPQSSGARRTSPEGITATRLRRRLAASQARAQAVAKGIARRACPSFGLRSKRPEHDPRQLSLLFLFRETPSPNPAPCGPGSPPAASEDPQEAALREAYASGDMVAVAKLKVLCDIGQVHRSSAGP